MTPTADRRRIFFTENNELWGMELAGQRRRTRVTFNVTVRVDEREEWAQILNESWRVMKYRFYDEEMHGSDWNAIRLKYEPLLKYVGANEDVYDLANEMIGELNASHTGVSGPDSDPQPSGYQTRYLGFEMMPDAGGYKVAYVYRDGPADKEWINIKVGDYITAIDGTPIKAGDNYWQLLNSPLNEYVTVSVASAPTGAGKRDVRHALDRLAQRAEVRRVGAEEPRDRRQGDERPDRLRPHPGDEPAVAREVPERSQPVLEQEGDHRRHPLQRRRQHRPGDHRAAVTEAVRILEQPLGRADLGPPAAAGDRRTEGHDDQLALGSDSEVTPMAFKQLGLGRVVGNPTSAAVIATGSYALINGGSIRTPGSLVVTYDPERPNNYGINLENYGVTPDVWIENTPEDELKGVDRELQAAIDEVMRMLKEGLWQYRGK